MPGLLMTPAGVERWPKGTTELELQKPTPDDAIVKDPALEKKAAWRLAVCRWYRRCRRRRTALSSTETGSPGMPAARRDE